MADSLAFPRRLLVRTRQKTPSHGFFSCTARDLDAIPRVPGLSRSHEAHEECQMFLRAKFLRHRVAEAPAFRAASGSATDDAQLSRRGRGPNAELDDLEVARQERAERRVQHVVVPARV